jgi:hypothetical protein
VVGMDRPKAGARASSKFSLFWPRFASAPVIAPMCDGTIRPGLRGELGEA